MLPLLVLLFALALATPAGAQGPSLQVAPDELAASLRCEGEAPRVLLVPGTGENPDFYAWNYVPALRERGLDLCTVQTPANATGDIQIAAEYVVYAIRAMHARAGARISIIGHSQGGMVPRWALKWWPDTRTMVDDLIGLAPSNHGTTAARSACGSECNAATWQQRDDSKFIAALNKDGETFAPVDYTTVFTHRDEVVTPPPSAALQTGDGERVNVATQDLCPLNTSEHLALGSFDPVGYALAMDALLNDGPASPARVPASVCSEPYHEGVDGATFATDMATGFGRVIAQFAGGEMLPAEPPLACYVTATCADEQAEDVERLAVTVRPRKVKRGRRARVRVAVTDDEGVPVRGARVVIGKRKAARTGRRGIARLTVCFRARGKRTVRVTRSGYRAGRATLRVVR